MREALVMLSDDLAHDHHAVHKFKEMAIHHLRTVQDVQIDEIHEWSDGCAGHYKSVKCMVDLSYTESDFGCKMIRNYYGSEHGKGDSDGITGTIKTSIEMAVLSGPVLIRNAEDCYEYCKKNLTEGKNHAKDDYASESLRKFFLVTDIDHTRNRTETLNKVPGLRKLHSIVSLSQLRVNCRVIAPTVWRRTSPISRIRTMCMPTKKSLI